MQLDCKILHTSKDKQGNLIVEESNQNVLFGYVIVLVAAVVTVVWMRFIYQLEILNDEELGDYDESQVTCSDFTVQLDLCEEVFTQYYSEAQELSFSQFIQDQLKEVIIQKKNYLNEGFDTHEYNCACLLCRIPDTKDEIKIECVSFGYKNTNVMKAIKTRGHVLSFPLKKKYMFCG